jgi:hypothetical protein
MRDIHAWTPDRYVLFIGLVVYMLLLSYNEYVKVVNIINSSGNRCVIMVGYFPTSKHDKWGTPPDLYASLHTVFNFNFDPCPIDWKEGDASGLDIPWGTSTFCNPPYSKTAAFIAKAHAEWKKGNTVVMLLNNNTETVAFHKYIYNQAEVRLLKGRLKFIDYSDGEPKQKPRPSPRGSMIVIFD